MRARDLGLACGKLPPGEHNSIADVPGVTVGHTTVVEGDVRTGVTAILPHRGNLFRDKVVAAAVVLNGFGKSTGLMQVNELGTLETPILLTNTFAVGTCANSLIRRAIAADPEIGRQTATVNPVVLECNDGYLNDIQAMAVTEAHADRGDRSGERGVRGRRDRRRNRHELLRPEGWYRQRIAAVAAGRRELSSRRSGAGQLRPCR